MDLNYGMKPFWFWNGDMKEDEIVRQIREMKDKGLGGYFLHPRQGMTVPYLSKKWFDKVAFAVEESKKAGLEVWLYDEYPYPSGAAGGEVILGHPEYEAKTLAPLRMDVSGSEEVQTDLPWGNIIMAAAYPLAGGEVIWGKPVDLTSCIGICRSEKIFQMSGLTAYNRKRFFEGNTFKRLTCRLPAGQWRICIFVEKTLEHMKFFGRFVDPIYPGAVARFIETTHEQYKKYLGNEFGKTIKGIFSDEIDLSPHGNPIRWSSCLPELFLQRNGYKLADRLPALLEPMGKDTAKVRYDYWNTMVEAFIERYDRQIGEWCRRNNLLYAAEKPILRSSQLKYIDVPGIDAGHQKVNTEPKIANEKYRANAKLLSSAAHFYGKQRALCESYHSIGWGMTLQDMKWIFDWLAVQGVDALVPHAFFYTTDGLAKHDAPPSSFFQAPAWKHTGLLSQYTVDVCSKLSGGKTPVDILVVDPATSLWTAMGEKSNVHQKLEMDFSTIQKELMKNHLDYYIADPQLLAEGKISGSCLDIKGEQFKILVLPPILNIEPAALDKIVEFQASGGIIIACGCLPAEDLGAGSDPAGLFGNWLGVDVKSIYNAYVNSEKPAAGMIQKQHVFFVSEPQDVAGVAAGHAARDISIRSGGKENRDILAVHKETQEGDYYFLVNTSGHEYETVINFKADIGNRRDLLTISPGLDGQCSAEDYELKNGYISFSKCFSPYQSRMYLLPKENTGGRIKADPVETRYKLDLEGEWNLRLKGLNALRINTWEMKVERVGGEKLPRDTGGRKVECKPAIDQIADSAIPLPVKLAEHFGCPKEFAFPKMECCYSVEFTVDTPVMPLLLVMEPGSIEGKWTMEVNGHRLESLDFRQQQVYLPSNLATDISAFIAQGKNILRVCVQVENTFDGLVNPLYLFGSFGVYGASGQGEWRLAELPEKDKIGSNSGLPFYAGEIVYRRQLDLDTADGKALIVFIDSLRLEDPVTLYMNGHCAGTRAWSPFEWSIDTAWLKQGKNEIELHIATTLLGLFEGQRFDPVRHKYVDCE